jgi:metallo-beta-lactamase family protein
MVLNMSATLSFWGAVGAVTGSKYLLETDKARIMIDCGIFQGGKELREKNWQDLPFNVKDLDAVVLTHAHTDHIGYLPRIVKQGFRGPIYCSRATASLAALLLEDSARLQEEEAEWRNKENRTRHNPALPLFNEADAKKTINLLRPYRLAKDDKPLQIAKGITAEFTPVGHLLGARSILLTVENAGENGETRRIFFSGDVGRTSQPFLLDPDVPPACDYMLVESTYGDRLHETVDPKVPLAQLLNRAAKENIPVLIPSFAIGRTQEILYHIRELEESGKVPVLPVWVDSPMASEATKIYLQCVDEYDEEAMVLERQHINPIETGDLRIAARREDSKALNFQQGARVIISASGMMSGGRILHHARHILPNPKAILCFAGYQAEETLGREILEGAKEVTLFKEVVPVNCHVQKISFSGHADYGEILNWLTPLASTPPRQVFIVHGEPVAAEAMQGHLVEKFGWNVTLPHYGEKFTL